MIMKKIHCDIEHNTTNTYELGCDLYMSSVVTESALNTRVWIVSFLALLRVLCMLPDSAKQTFRQAAFLVT